jgi:hypothetical protein
MMLSDKFLPTAVGMALTALLTLLAPRIAKVIRVNTKTVAALGALLIASLFILLILIDFTKLPKPQPWVGPVILPFGVLLWAVVFWKWQWRVEAKEQELSGRIDAIVGAPNFTVMHGQNVQTPFQYPTIASISNALLDAKDGIRAIANWEKWRQEDNCLAPPDLSAQVNLIDDHTLEISITVTFSTDMPVAVSCLTFGWLKHGVEWTGKEDGREIVWFPLFGGEREVSRMGTFTERFELERSFAQRRLPYPHLVGLAFTAHHIAWRSWSCGV